MTLKEVLDRGYAKEIYEFALNNPNTNVELLTQALLKSKRLPDRYDIYDDEYPIFEDYELEHYYYVFARDVKGTNIDLLCQAVANTKASQYIYNFASSIEGANIQLLEENLLDTYDDETIYKFARDVEGANIKTLEKGMQHAYPVYIYLFARDIDGANIEFLQNSLINWAEEGYDTDFCEYACEFAQNIESANIDKMISDIKLYISDYYLSGKKFPSENYIETLKELLEQLRVIQKNKKNNAKVKVLKKKIINNLS